MEWIVERVIALIDAIPQYLGYLIIVGSSLLQQWFPPYPGDSFALVAGFMSVASGYWTAGIFAAFWLTTVGSSVALFELARRMGQAFLRIPLVAKFITEKTYRSASRLVEKYQAWALAICKFVPGVNSIVIIICGIMGFSRRKAYIGMAAASLVHNLILFIAGRYVGQSIEGIKRFLTTYNVIVLSLVGVALVVFLAVKLIIWLRKRKEGV